MADIARKTSSEGQATIVVASTILLGVLACLYQAAVIRSSFPALDIPYGYFEQGAHPDVRAAVISRPLWVTATVFAVFGVVAAAHLFRHGFRWRLLIFLLLLLAAFLPFLIFNFVSAFQGDAPVFI